MSGRQLRVGLVTESTGIENPYIRPAYLGLERAVRELGIRGRVLTPAPKEGYGPSLSLLARQKYDLVIGAGFYPATALTASPPGSPTRDSQSSIPPKTSCASPGERPGPRVPGRASRLSGRTPGRARADAHSREEVISSVGGHLAPAVERYIAGYQAGARGANPRVTALNGYTDPSSIR